MTKAKSFSFDIFSQQKLLLVFQFSSFFPVQCQIRRFCSDCSCDLVT